MQTDNKTPILNAEQQQMVLDTINSLIAENGEVEGDESPEVVIHDRYKGDKNAYCIDMAKFHRIPGIPGVSPQSILSN